MFVVSEIIARMSTVACDGRITLVTRPNMVSPILGQRSVELAE